MAIIVLAESNATAASAALSAVNPTRTVSARLPANASRSNVAGFTTTPP
jgi:hypothetical protein